MKTIIQKNNDCVSVCQEINGLVEPDIIMLTPADRQEIEKLEWISVDERLPDPYKKTICIYEFLGNRYITMGYNVIDEWVDEDGISLEKKAEWPRRIVTHWRPLPSMPDLE